MQIAVVYNAENTKDDYADFIYTLLEDEAVKNEYTLQQWGQATPKQNTLVVIPCKYSSQLATAFWYRVTLPSILQKINASVVINLDAVIHPSLKISQIAFAESAGFLTDKKQCTNASQLYANKCFRHHDDRQCSFIFPSTAQANELKDINRDISAEIIHYTSLSPVKEREWHEKLMIRARESSNTEYFLSVIDDDIETFMTLMKAFSKFKKWQQSSMQLILISSNDFLMDDIREKLSSYKYRNDVQLLTEAADDRSDELISAAYSFIYLQKQPVPIPGLLHIMLNGTPLICQANDEIKEYCGDSVIYTAANDADSLGDTMLMIYKDENIKSLKAAAGKERALLYKSEEQGKKLWSLISKATHTPIP